MNRILDPFANLFDDGAAFQNPLNGQQPDFYTQLYTQPEVQNALPPVQPPAVDPTTVAPTTQPAAVAPPAQPAPVAPPVAPPVTTPVTPPVTQPAVVQQNIVNQEQQRLQDSGAQTTPVAQAGLPSLAPAAVPPPVVAPQVDLAANIGTMTQDQKAEEYNRLIGKGFTEDQIRKAAEDKYGQQSQQDWNALKGTAKYQTDLTAVKSAPQTLQGLLTNPNMSATDIRKTIDELKSNPAVSGVYSAALEKFSQLASKDYSGEYGGKKYESLNPLAVSNVLSQLQAQQKAGTAQYYKGGAMGSKDQGFGSLDAVTEDMAKNLVAAGITDIRQVGKIPQYQKAEEMLGFNGQPAIQDEDGNYFVRVPGPKDEDGNPTMGTKYVDKSQLQKIYGSRDEDGGFIPIDSSKIIQKNGVPMYQNGEVIGNKLTGEPLSKASNYAERTQGNAWSGTFRGDGNTGYNVQFDKSGNPIFYTTGASSSDMQQLAPILALASFIPGAAPFVAAINAAYAAHEGNWKQAILSALPAVGEIANMAGASANTVSNINSASKAANLANAVANKDILGTIMSGMSVASDQNMMGADAFNPSNKIVGDFSAKDLVSGAAAAKALSNGDYTTLANIGAQMSGNQDAVTAAKGLTLVKALQSNNPMAIAQAVQKMSVLANSIGKGGGMAGGGLASLPGLIKNGNKNTLTDKTAFDGLNGSLVAKMLNQQPPEIRAALLKKLTQAA